MTPVLGAVSQFSLELFFLLSSYPFGKIYFPDREISLARFSFLDYPFYTFFFFFFCCLDPSLLVRYFILSRWFLQTQLITVFY